MKKILFILMMMLGVSVFGAIVVNSTGEFKKEESSYVYPSIAVLYDDSDGKYDIYRYSWDHGFMLEKGNNISEETFKATITSRPKDKLLTPFKYKGKLAKNLCLEEVNKILEEMLFEEY